MAPAEDDFLDDGVDPRTWGSAPENRGLYRGQRFWSGVADVQTGEILEIHTFEEAQYNDFNDFYVSEDSQALMRDGTATFFWIDAVAGKLEPQYEVRRPNGAGKDWLDVKTQVLKRIERQIKILPEAHQQKQLFSAQETLYSLLIPEEDADHVAYQLGLAELDFDVEVQPGTERLHFNLASRAELEVAREIVRQAFRKQIEQGQGDWAYWKMDETQDAMEGRLPEKASAAVGEYDTESVRDVAELLEQYRSPSLIAGKDVLDSEGVKIVLAKMDELGRIARTTADMERYFGTMVYLRGQGVNIGSKRSRLAREMGTILMDTGDYLNAWRNALMRKHQIREEFKLLA